jgi:hypothetical protein
MGGCLTNRLAGGCSIFDLGGDKRNDISAYGLRAFRLSPSVSSRLEESQAGGVVFSKLSKLLNQEDALGAPCLQRFAITVARPGTRGVAFASVCANWKPSYADYLQPGLP